MVAQRFEPMSVGRILDRTFRLYRNNFFHFIAIMAVVFVPIGLLTYVLMRPVATTMEEDGMTMGGMATTPDIGPGTVLLLMLLVGISVLLCVAALTKSISESYLGNRLTVGGAYRAVVSRLFGLIGLIILVWLVSFGLMIVMGSVLVLGLKLGFWGAVIAELLLFAFLLRLSLSAQGVVLERIGPFAAIKRSWLLTTGNFWRTFGLAVLVYLISIVIVLLFFFGFVFIAPLLGGVDPGVAFSAVFILMAVAQVLTTPIWAGAFILLYYDLRIRKEGFDLQMLAQSLGSAAQKVPEHGVPPVQH